MEKIAQGKFNFDSDTIKNIKRDHLLDTEKQNSVLIEKWAKKVGSKTVIVSVLC